LSYTSVEIVKQYLSASSPVRDKYFDETLVMPSDGWASFYGGSIEAGSLIVKSVQSNELFQFFLSLQTGDNQLPAYPLIRGSVIVASDSSLGTIYIENDDYVIDYARGKLRIKEGSRLTVNQTVAVWYQAFLVYDAGDDYEADQALGRLKRCPAGRIAAGETVFVDFSAVDSSYNDVILEQAVVEANGIVEAEVDPERQFGADTLLQAAATCRALEIVCNAAATREMSGLQKDDHVALAWMKLADRFVDRSRFLLRAFHPPLEGPSSPTTS
jgi:hypothetical protein